MNSMLMRGLMIGLTALSGSLALSAQVVVSSGFEQLDRWASECLAERSMTLGYPGNNDIRLEEFYRWYTGNNLESMIINNAGDPFEEGDHTLSSLDFEREVIQYFAPKYGFDGNDLWGIVTMSGTDGNNHGIYFGVNYLKRKTGKMPVVYVSDEAHYSNYRLCDLQHLEVRLVKSDSMGRMVPDSLEKVLDPTRPCLIVYAMGSTFKGAIDDQKALDDVLARHEGMAVYRHVDAALFGGYLPFTEYKDLVDRRKTGFDSISVSGHKFFGIDSPCGLFITTRDVYDNQSTYDISYLNANMRMINCSRSGIEPLKFWWLVKTVGDEGWTEQAARIFENTRYLKSELKRIGWPYWNNEYSNTVIFRRPSAKVVRKYNLACGEDAAFGGKLSHVVVMQHVTKDSIDRLIADLRDETISDL
ncbi:MAG: aminotransferase class V-fold PLP-dependent enzyme [Bacteroidales bacterium]|nr:aminotransferase class V-fold PLP-dependent enzyme [Bacteroidales bacterium]